MRSNSILMLCVLFMIIGSSVSLAIKVSPGVFTVNNVPVGENTLLGIELKVHNNSDEVQQYEVSVIAPPETGNILEGYIPIPNTEFFYIEGENEFEVPPRTVESRKMYCSIPDTTIYYNQKWEVSVTVSAGKGMLRTAVGTRYFIETVPKETETAPYGDIGLSPSAITFGPEKLEGKVKIYNSTEKKLDLELTPYIPEVKESGGITIRPAVLGSFSEALFGVIEIEPEKISVAPGGTAEIGITCKEMPEENSEVLIKIESEETFDFIRVFYSAGQ
ncbi:hypothetical protein DRQ36_04475 [bacterium]|nr:MAG: hypothetical protein DRQ36_04475 [bacterium]